MGRRSIAVHFPGALGERLAARLDLPATPPRAWAVFAHCFACSKDFVASARIARALAERGFGVLRFDFTGLGDSAGEFANTDFSSNLDDLVAAAQWLAREHGPPRLLVGHSLGGAAVLGAAHRVPECVAVATIGAPFDPDHVRQHLCTRIEEIEQRGEAEVQLGGRRFTIRKQFLQDLERHDLADEIAGLGRALLIMHAPGDRVVGIDNARRIFEAARHPKSFVSLADADHLLTRRQDAEYVAEVLAAWASRYLPQGGGAEAAPPPLAAAQPAPAAATAAGAAPLLAGGRLERGGEQGRQRLRRPRVELLLEAAGRYAVQVQAGPHRLWADEPPALGGGDRGPTPLELLLAALGSCTAITIRMYAERKGWPLERVAVSCAHEPPDGEAQHGSARERLRCEIALAGALEPAQRERLEQIARRCPVHRLLQGAPEIVTRLAAGQPGWRSP